MNLTRTLDVINYFYAEYIEFYQDHDLTDFVKMRYERIHKYLERDQHFRGYILNKFEVVTQFHGKPNELYHFIGCEVFHIKEAEVDFFVEKMRLRESLLKTISRGIDLEHSYKERNEGKLSTKQKHLINMDAEICNKIEFKQISSIITQIDKSIEYAFNILKGYKAEIPKPKKKKEVIFLEEEFKFNELINWAQELNDAGNLFKNRFGYYPNIMMASSITYNKIDLVANTRPDKIKGGDLHKHPSEFVGLTGFKGEGFDLEWCVDENLTELCFDLIYDSDPDGGIPLDETNKKKLKAS